MRFFTKDKKKLNYSIDIRSVAYGNVDMSDEFINSVTIIPTPLAHPQSKDHWNWKGNEVGYAGKHIRIKKKLGKPEFCEGCGTENSEIKYEWANISGDYLLDESDWTRLCIYCHKTHDLKGRKRKGKSGKWLPR